MAVRRVRAKPTMGRKIYFYRVDAGIDNSGHPLPFNAIPVLKHIDSMPWTTQGRYFMDSEGRITCLWVDKIGPPHKIRIGDIRRSELPQVEEGGLLSPLGIPPELGIAEQIHAVFFDNNIVGADFNFYGPRISRLSEYFPQKAQRFCPPILFFEPLLRQDVLKQLERFKDIRMFSLKIRYTYASIIAQANQVSRECI